MEFRAPNLKICKITFMIVGEFTEAVKAVRIILFFFRQNSEHWNTTQHNTAVFLNRLYVTA